MQRHRLDVGMHRDTRFRNVFLILFFFPNELLADGKNTSQVLSKTINNNILRNGHNVKDIH